MPITARITVLFTDIQMPGSMDGLRLAAVVRDRWPPIALLITSGQQRPPTGDFPTGARFIPKPYSPFELKDQLHSLTGGAANDRPRLGRTPLVGGIFRFRSNRTMSITVDRESLKQAICAGRPIVCRFVQVSSESRTKSASTAVTRSR